MRNLLGAEVTYFKGGQTFASLRQDATFSKATSMNQKWEWAQFPDEEYLYIQMTSKVDGAVVEFQVSGVGDR